ncbi:MAG: hypothetical protein KDC92_14675 [Bacteroidetes bacterium]|nr:hypothetical protein [Bacteroidota bacterium]
MENFLLIAHIVSGSIALLFGLMAAITRKGSKRHVQSGNIFFWTMMISSATAIWLAIIHPNPFLLSIGIFTAYFCLTGKLIFIIKSWFQLTVLAVLGLVSSVALIVFDVQDKTISLGSAIGVITLVFAVLDIANQPKGSSKAIYHGIRMGSAYISATTAFTVNAIDFLPWYVGWILPSVIGTTMLFIGIGRFRKRMDM